MTPLKIEMLLHFYCCAEPFPRMSAPACIDALREFEEERLVEVPINVDRPVLTTRGNAYIHFLTVLPLPMETWTLPGPLQFSMPGSALPTAAARGVEIDQREAA